MTNYPFKSHSWTLINPYTVLKKADLSLLKEAKTGIPKDIIAFFPGLGELPSGSSAPLSCFYQKKNIELKAEHVNGRIRLGKLPLNDSITLNSAVLFEKDENDQIQLNFVDLSNDLRSVLSQGSTEKLSEVRVRLKQSLFRQNVLLQSQGRCLVTGVAEPSILIASHIKSWKESTDTERIDGHNGLLLAPHIDKLFDKHLISFSEHKEIIVSCRLDPKVLDIWSVDLNKTYNISDRQQVYLAFHRRELTRLDALEL